MTEQADSISAVSAVGTSSPPEPVSSVPVNPVPMVMPAKPPSRNSVPARRSVSPDSDKRSSAPITSRSAPDLETALHELNQHLAPSGKVMELRPDTAVGRTVAVIKNAQTGEVLQQFPSEDSLKLAEMLSAWSKGDGSGLLDLLA